MRIYQLLLILALCFWGCSPKQEAKIPSTFKQVELKNNDDLMVLVAYDKLNSGLETEALDSFYELFSKNKNKVFAKEALRLAYILKDSRLEELMKFARKNMKNDFNVLRILIVYEIERGNTSAAKKLSLELVSKEPLNSSNHSLLGTIYALEHNNALALFSLKRAYAIEPSETNLLKLVNLLGFTLNKKAQALNFINDWVGKYGCSKQVCALLIEHYAQKEDVKNMAKIFVKLYDKFGDVNYLMDALRAYVIKKDLEGAKNLLEEYTFDKELLMDVYLALGLFDDALKAANELYESSKDGKYLGRIAMMKYEKSGKNPTKQELAEVISLFDKVISNGSDDSILLNYYGYLLIYHDIDVKKGLELVFKAHEIDPSANYIIDSIAWGYYKLGDCKAAKEWLDKVANDDEFVKNEEYIEHLAAINKCLMEKK